VSVEADRLALRTAAERLERVTAALSDEDAAPEEVKRLAEEALALSAEITERLPRVLRALEAGEG
jgi:hypothetical protein